MEGFILEIEGFQNLKPSETLKIRLENNEIEKVKLQYEVKDCKNAKSSLDSRVLIMEGNINRVLETNKTIMHCTFL